MTDRAEIARRAREWIGHGQWATEEKLIALLLAERDAALAEVEAMLEEGRTSYEACDLKSDMIEEVRRMREALKTGGG